MQKNNEVATLPGHKVRHITGDFSLFGVGSISAGPGAYYVLLHSSLGQSVLESSSLTPWKDRLL